MHGNRIAGHRLCIFLLCATLGGSWMWSSSVARRNTIVSQNRIERWKQPEIQRSDLVRLNKLTFRGHYSRTQTWASLVDPSSDASVQVAAEATTAGQQNDAEQNLEIPQSIHLAGSSVDSSNEETHGFWSKFYSPDGLLTNITDQDIAIAYECFYNVSETDVHEALGILAVYTDMLLSRNVSALYEKVCEVARTEHLPRLEKGYQVTVSFLEAFADTWAELLRGYRKVLEKIITAAKTSENAVQQVISENHDLLLTPGFERFLDGEIDRFTEENAIVSMLRGIKLRILSEVEATLSEELKAIPRLAAMKDETLRFSELEYFIRSSKEPSKRADILMETIASTLKDLEEIDIVPAESMALAQMLESLRNSTKTIKNSL